MKDAMIQCINVSFKYIKNIKKTGYVIKGNELAK